MVSTGIAGLLIGAAAPALDKVVDPLDAPAAMTLDPTSAPLLSVAKVGSQLVAVGPRGVILVGTPSSDGRSAGWRQVAAPVQSDLVKVVFSDTQNGWVCGHDGVILKTSDGGMHWQKQFDGIAAREVFETYYQNSPVPKDASLAAKQASALNQIRANFDNGPSMPWLGMAFSDAQSGYVVGPFGDIAKTNNAGQSWSPMLEGVDNPNFYALNAIAEIGGRLYMAGEQGLVYVYDATHRNFTQSSTGYQGNLFGIVGTQDVLVTFGLNGTIYRSVDGAKSWSQVSDASSSTIMSGVVLPDGRIVLVAVDGAMLISADQGKTFSVLPQTQDMPLADVALLDPKTLVVVGLGGVRYVRLH
jgi:photosystem II stability/assembly factor-like uncharacterized protein